MTSDGANDGEPDVLSSGVDQNIFPAFTIYRLMVFALGIPVCILNTTSIAKPL